MNKTITRGDVFVKFKLDVKPIIGTAMIAIFAAGCQLSSPSNTSQNNSNSTSLSQASERMSDLNLTEAQKAQMKQIREQSQAKITALLSPEQQAQFKDAAQGKNESPMRVIRNLNLSETQKQQVREIIRAQRQQFRAILTPEQQEKMKQNRGWKEESSSN
ncbi:Spy/CpxP family protein refolding chaperone [Iningainema tapete]|uniref:Spy/CpxP family protein refolding chaperone n=1 Tax=Iningainema tapete TaxID=2806730 RepID=UPI0030D809AF